jgi:hypothetical protein|tara:strand:+ start:754 stop:1425 length:672 start_codon:yes stop_codon:yes gene_type:complete
MPIKKDIVYPVFIECLQFTEDIFWENIFEDLAYGKTPYGTYISKDFLCCKYKKKDFSYKIERKDPEILYEEVYNLLANKLGLLSSAEKIKKKKMITDLETNLKNSGKNWIDIKKKNIKETLIELYVTKMKNKYFLSISQARYLLSIIFIAIVFKVITNKDIEYENGVIHNIKGIDFIKKQIIVEKDLYNLEVSFAPEIVLDKNLMVDSWEKYLKDLKRTSVLE